MPGFALVQPLFTKIDTTTASFVSDISSNAVATITPVVVVALTFSFIAYGLAVIAGKVDTPFTDYILRSVKVAMIVGAGLTVGLYQSDIAAAITGTPDALATALMTSPTAMDATTGGIIDDAMGKGFDQAGEAFDKAGFFSENGITFALLGTIIIIATAIFGAIGAAFLIIAKLALALLAGLGPIFIASLLFPATTRFFESWVGQVVNYGLIIVLFASIFTLLVTLYGDYMDQVAFDGASNIYYTVGGSVILSVALIFVLLQIPAIAAGLGGGASMGFFHQLQGARNAIGSTGNTVGNGMGGSYRSGRSGALGAAHATGSAVSSGVRRSVGYFRR